MLLSYLAGAKAGASITDCGRGCLRIHRITDHSTPGHAVFRPTPQRPASGRACTEDLSASYRPMGHQWGTCSLGEEVQTRREKEGAYYSAAYRQDTSSPQGWYKCKTFNCKQVRILNLVVLTGNLGWYEHCIIGSYHMCAARCSVALWISLGRRN